MAKQWDDLMKTLVRTNPQAFVSWLVEEATFQKELDRELITRSSEADLLCAVLWGGHEIVLHVEFQRQRDPRMGRRLWEYNSTTDCLRKRPVYSIVVYLVKDNGIVESPYQQMLPNGEVIHTFNFRNIKLWEIPAAMFKQTGLESMLPLLPLTREGEQRETVEEMISSLQAAGKDDLLPIGLTLAALIFKADADKRWLRERYKHMFDLLEDSWFYQEIMQKGLDEGLQKGMQQGIQQGMQQGIQQGMQQGIQQGIQMGRDEGFLQGLRPALMHIIERLFPELTALAQQQLMLITNPAILQEVSDRLLTAQTTEEARQILLNIDNTTFRT